MSLISRMLMMGATFTLAKVYHEFVAMQSHTVAAQSYEF